MKIAWCWACRCEHPMLDKTEFDAVWAEFQRTCSESRHALYEAAERRGDPSAATARILAFRPLQDAYEKLTRMKLEGGDPKVILHYRISFYGPPCPYCGILLRSMRAKQCFECGMDWHDPSKIVSRK